MKTETAEIVEYFHSLDEKIARRQLLNQSGPDKLGEWILKLQCHSTVEQYQVETVLKKIGENVFAVASDIQLSYFAKSSLFVQSLFQIIRRCSLHQDDEDMRALNNCALFSTHKSYEIALYFLLCLAEKGVLLTSLFSTLNATSLGDDIVRILGRNLSSDICYHTQVFGYATNRVIWSCVFF
jgi:hypothetical protein